ncbi:MuF-C-terminal domain-containing protein [Caballeronia arvi]|nr:hypothetical protein [Caballeronia arvi]
MEDPNYRELLGLVMQANMAGIAEHSRIIVVGKTPPVLLALPGLAISQLPLVITGKVIDKVHFDHGITRPVLERLYDTIARPKAIYRSETAGGAVVVTFEVRPVSLPVIVALHPGKQLGRKACNVIASIYAKDFAGIEEVWKKRGLLLWELKRKCPAGVTTTEALIAKCGTTP